MPNLFLGLLHRTIAALRQRGLFDAADEAENFVAAAEAGRVYEPRGRPDAMAEWQSEVEKELHIDSTGHRARVRLELERTWKINLGDDEHLAIADAASGTRWDLRLARDQSPERGRVIILESAAFPDAASAERAARRIEAAVLAVSVRRGFGVALSDRLPPGVITKYGLQAFLPDGIRGIQDRLGVTVYETPPPTVFISMGHPTVSVSTPGKDVVTSFEASLAGVVEVDESTRTAYELFASSRFENSSRARFLLLVMAVEAMTERLERPPAEVAFVDGMLKHLAESPIPPEARSALENALTGLKTQSIRAATAAQIAKDVSAEAASAFRKLYGLRSRLVHGGKAVVASELSNAGNKLEPIVKAMLLKRLTRGSFLSDR